MADSPTYLRATASRCRYVGTWGTCETTITGVRPEVRLLPVMRGQIVGRLPAT